MSIFGKRKVPYNSIKGTRSSRINPSSYYLVKYWDSKGTQHKTNISGRKLLGLKKKRGVKIYDYYKDRD